MQNTFTFTKEGYDKLNSELSELVSSKRQLAVERLRKAREMGDLSENSEYTAAKEDLAFVEGRIQEVEEIIKRSIIVENNEVKKFVSIGCRVVVNCNGKKDTFCIVGELESDPINKKLSSKSPIGKALFGMKVGEKVNVTIPAGTITYVVEEIN